MKVVRYTFDICFRDCAEKDEYGMASEIEKSIMSCKGVCGCETRRGGVGYGAVNIDAAIGWQRRNKKWIDNHDGLGGQP